MAFSWMTSCNQPQPIQGIGGNHKRAKIKYINSRVQTKQKRPSRL